MYNIGEGVGSVVAADTQTSVRSLDLAVVSQARMFATVVEAASAAQLPMIAIQALLDSLTTGMRNLVASRSDLAAAVRELNVIRAQSTVRETNFGCPVGPEAYVFMEDRRPVESSG
jgi:hypothetical protein